MDDPILLSDGDCNFCRACVRWAVKRDREGVVLDAQLQSEAGKRLLRENGLPADYRNSVVLVDEDGVHLRSDGVLKLLRHIGGKWKLVVAGMCCVPRFIRDFGYELVARNRSSISKAVGTINQRWEPPERVQDRFLDDG